MTLKSRLGRVVAYMEKVMHRMLILTLVYFLTGRG